MKKFLVGSVMLLVIAAGAAITANAQYCRTRSYRSNNYGYNNYNTRYAGYNNRRYNRRSNRGYNQGYQTAYYSTPVYYGNEGYYSNRNRNRVYYNNNGYSSNRPNFYRRHRNAVNIGAGTGIGAIIGALAGGRRGALAGALLGGGGGALYTYGIKPKRRYYTRYR
jgi:hypothetical protein